MSQLEGKRILVTGAGQGMGSAIALGVAAAGAEAIVVTDVNEANGNAIAIAVRDCGVKSTFIKADLRSGDEIKALIEDAVAFMGGLDCVVNNAGVIDSQITDDATIEGLDEATWDLVMDVNLKAIWLITKFAAPHLRASGRGATIINSASVAGVNGNKAGVAYGASKAAVIQFTKSSALFLAPDVRVNCYLPGAIETPMALGHIAASPDPADTVRRMTGAHLLPRMGESSEVADLVCFLASDQSSFITGVAIPIDGGMLAWRGLRN
ncbi:MAG: SDR family NAD(P)-dependent oxidoreductase [Candidatus Nanopelagicales bacterium]